MRKYTYYPTNNYKTHFIYLHVNMFKSKRTMRKNNYFEIPITQINSEAMFLNDFITAIKCTPF